MASGRDEPRPVRAVCRSLRSHCFGTRPLSELELKLTRPMRCASRAGTRRIRRVPSNRSNLDGGSAFRYR